MVTFTGRDAFQRFIHGYYYYVLVIFAISVVVMWVIVHSPFGKALQAIRDNETRAEFVGIQVWHYRWMAFLVSGVFTGLAGALWVPLNGLTTPEVLYWPFSGELVFMTVLTQLSVGAFVGFDGSPWRSGQMNREQGISKRGNRRVRALLVEAAQRWVRQQPDSALSQWFLSRVGATKGAHKRKMIVALARKLAVALWRYLETGLVPAGAVLKPEAARA